MKSLLSVDQLQIVDIEKIFQFADQIIESEDSFRDVLKNKIFLNFFFENSTRTRLSFEMAAKKMGAKVTNIDISLSSLKKGESLYDMAKTISALGADYVAIRHDASGIVSMLDEVVDSKVINAGDGMNEHPTQALLDNYVIRNIKKEHRNVKIAICGDVLHSRVARSNLKLMAKLGSKINVVVPPTMITDSFRDWLQEGYGAELYNNMEDGIQDCDVLMMLRIQNERMKGSFIPSKEEYFRFFGLNKNRLRLAKEDAIILHPGPINRDVEISSELVDSKRCYALQQIEVGVYIRMAIMLFLSQNN